MTDVFISYSRKDIAFARLLHQAINENNLETWIDWQDIPPSTDWLAEVYEAIEQADAFVFVISETSLKSEICGLEIIHAAKHNKRLIPVAINDVDSKLVPKELAVLNWIFFDDAGDKFADAMEDLVTAITLDQEWVKNHTRFENRALAWERKGDDKGLLLRGSDLIDAESWLAGAAGKDPQPTSLQTQYILESRNLHTRRQRLSLLSIGAGLMVSIMLGILAMFQRDLAIQEGAAKATAQEYAESESNIKSTEIGIRKTAQNILEDKNLELLVNALSVQSINYEQIPISESLGLASELYNIKANEYSITSLISNFHRFYPAFHFILEGHSRGISDIEFGNTSNIFASISMRGNEIIVWDGDVGIQIGRLDFDQDTYLLPEIEFGPNDEYLYISRHEKIMVWDIYQKKIIDEIDVGHTTYCLDINADGTLIAVGLGSSEIDIINMESNDIDMLYGESTYGEPEICEFSNDGKKLAVVFYGHQDAGTVQILNIDKNSEHTNPIHFEEIIRGVSFRSSDELIIGGGGLLTSIDINNGKINYRKDLYTEVDLVSDYRFRYPIIESMSYEPEMDYIVAGLADGQIAIFDGETSKYIRILPTQNERVTSVDISFDGIYLASAGDGDPTIYFRKWLSDNPNWRKIEISHPSQYLRTAIMSYDEKLLIGGDISEGNIYLWNIAEKSLFKEIPPGLYNSTSKIAISKDDKYLFFISENNSLIIWDIYQDSISSEIILPDDNYISTFSYNPEKDYLLIGESRGMIYLVEIGQISSGKKSPVPIGPVLNNYMPSNRILRLEISQDGNYIVSADFDNMVIWEGSGGSFKPVKIYTTGDDWIGGIAFSSKNDVFATYAAQSATEVKIWNLDTLKLLYTIPGFYEGVNNVKFSSNGEILYVSTRNEIHYWHSDSGKFISSIYLPNKYGTFYGESHSGDYLIASNSSDFYIYQSAPYFFQVSLCLIKNTNILKENRNDLLGELSYSLFCNDSEALNSAGDILLEMDEIDRSEHYYDLSKYFDNQSLSKVVGLVDSNFVLGKSDEIISSIEHIDNQSISIMDLPLGTIKQVSWAYLSVNRFSEAIQYLTRQIELSPDDGEGYNDRGYIYNEIDEYEKAIEDLEMAMELDPEEYGGLENYDRLAQSYFKINQLDQAEEYLQKILELNSFNSDGYNWLGWAYEDFELFDLSIENFTKQIEISPDNGEGYDDRGYVYYEIGEYEKAIEDLEKAIEIDSEEYGYDWNYDRLAYANFYLGNEEKSEEYLQKILELSDYGAWGYNWLGWAYEDFELFDLSIENFTKQIEISPENGDGYDDRGYVYYEMAEYEKAIQDIEKAIKIDPFEYGHGSNYDRLWWSYYYLGDYEKALAVLNESIESDKRYEGDLADRGRTHLKLGNEEEGREDMQAYLAENEFSSHSYNYVGLSYFYIDYYSDAIENLTRQIQLSPEDGDGYNDRGSVYYEIEEYDKAIQDIEKAIQLNPEEYRFDWNLDNLAYSYFYLGEFDIAEEYLLQILELKNYNETSYNWLGWSYLDFEKYDQAIISFEKAIELNQDYATPYNGLGDVYYAIENYDEALDNYLIYIDMEESPDQDVLGRIEELSN